MESLDQFRRLDICEKVRNSSFVMSLRLSDHKVLHSIASSSSFFDLARIFSLFSLVFRTSKFLEFKEFKKTIIPFALVGYETGYSQLGAPRLVGYLPSDIQRAQELKYRDLYGENGFSQNSKKYFQCKIKNSSPCFSPYFLYHWYHFWVD